VAMLDCVFEVIWLSNWRVRFDVYRSQIKHYIFHPYRFMVPTHLVNLQVTSD
jgi:hypothetical protein